jgi:hypothetical protein
VLVGTLASAWLVGPFHDLALFLRSAKVEKNSIPGAAARGKFI